MRGVKQVIGSGVRPRPAFPIYEYTPDNGQPIDIEKIPEEYESVLSSAIMSLADPDRGRVIVHGSEDVGKTFFIIQILHNLKAYKNKTSSKDFFPLYMSRNIYNELAQHFDTFEQYVKFVSVYFGIKETEVIIFVDHPEIAARIADSGVSSPILFESTESMFTSMMQAQMNGMTSVWSGWDTFNIDYVIMPRSQYIDLVYLSQKDRLKEMYNFDLRKKHVLSLVKSLTELCSVMTEENEDNPKDPIVRLNTALGATIIRRFAQLASHRKLSLANLSTEETRELIEEAQTPFASIIENAHNIAHMMEEDNSNSGGPIMIGIDSQGDVSVAGDDKSIEGLRGLFSALGVGIDSELYDDEPQKEVEPLVFTSNKTLASRMKKSIIGQDEAIQLVSDSMAIPTAKLNNPEKPLRTFLFLGPTGVGKTELSKVLAKELYKNEMNIIRLDMSEFSTTGSVTALFGSTPGYIGYNEEGGTLTREVSKHPNSLIILDEVEKAHADTWDAMLQVFDAGRMTTGSGKVVDFSKCVIVMTSNLGSKEMSTHKLGFGGSRTIKTSDELKNIAMGSLKKYFRPEFINRIDDIVVFKALDAESARKIVLKEVNYVIETLKNQNLTLIKPKNDILDEILNISNFEAYGAREVQRIVQKSISTPLAKAILDNKKNKKFKIIKDSELGMTVSVVE